MEIAQIRSAVLSLTLILSSAACGTVSRSPSNGPDRLTAAEVEALYRARVDSTRSRYTQADVDFMTHMIHHHAQALVMARLAPTHGASAQLRTLAARINNSQADEIATMQRWLADRGLPVTPVDTGMAGAQPGVHDHAASPQPATHDHAPGAAAMEMQMPGMLTPAQMQSLEQARGADFDRLFLTLMIQHHEGAVEMVKELFATDGAAQDEEAFKFASDAQVDQTTEIARMRQMLAGMPG